MPHFVDPQDLEERRVRSTGVERAGGFGERGGEEGTGWVGGGGEIGEEELGFDELDELGGGGAGWGVFLGEGQQSEVREGEEGRTWR